MRRTLFLFLVFLPPSISYAHPVDEARIWHTTVVTIHDRKITLDYRVLFGGIIAPRAWDEMDPNKDRTMSEEEQIAWAAKIFSGLNPTLDGKPLTFKLKYRHFPSFQDFITGGATAYEAYIAFRFVIDTDIPQGNHVFRIKNRNYLDYIDAEVLNKVNFKGKARKVFPPPESGREIEISFLVEGKEAIVSEGVSQGARIGRGPTSPGTIGAKEDVESEIGSIPPPFPEVAKPRGWSKRVAAFTKERFISLIKRERLGAKFIFVAFLISFLLGMIHALTPGHGKAIVAAYLVGSKGRIIDAVALGGIVTITHTGSVFILGLGALLITRYIRQEFIHAWLGFASGILISIMGFYLIYRGLYYRSTYMLNPEMDDHVYVHKHGLFGKPHKHFVSHPEDEHIHEEDHDHEHMERDERGERPPLWNLLSLGIAGGIVPCPDAMIVLMIAIASRRIMAGLALILAFSIGLAFTLIAIGVMMVLGVRFMVERMGKGSRRMRIAYRLPILSGVFVAVLGIIVAFQALVQAKIL